MASVEVVLTEPVALNETVTTPVDNLRLTDIDAGTGTATVDGVPVKIMFGADLIQETVTVINHGEEIWPEGATLVISWESEPVGTGEGGDYLPLDGSKSMTGILWADAGISARGASSGFDWYPTSIGWELDTNIGGTPTAFFGQAQTDTGSQLWAMGPGTTDFWLSSGAGDDTTITFAPNFTDSWRITTTGFGFKIINLKTYPAAVDAYFIVADSAQPQHNFIGSIYVTAMAGKKGAMNIYADQGQQSAWQSYRTTGGKRWSAILGDATPETGGSTGTNFILETYSDTGTASQPIKVERATGITTLQSLALNPLPTDALDDVAAAAAGVPVGGVYRNGSALMIRVT
jgi:hypothetical protein